MAKFLNSSGVTYHLEELIKGARDRLVLISPYLKFNDRMRELLEDKDRLKIDIRIVYGKNELQPEEINWLRSLEYVRSSFCKNLHAKCYLNESQAIISSMNLYEFSQVNNNEMGVLIQRADDTTLYHDAYEEVMRLIRISDEVKITVEKIAPSATELEGKPGEAPPASSKGDDGQRFISTTQLSKELNIPTKDLFAKLLDLGWIERGGDGWQLTTVGKSKGGLIRSSARYGEYIAWPESLKI